ncbi:MAG TPA: hypothetical protein DCR14_19160 [Acidimicrobiaceae bacterium]|nr:hypothetical protein [Acidimicrobiaceae bacterium]
MASSAPAFRLFGFPVHVRVGFLLFMVIVVALNGPEFGIALAIFMAVFTLLHELGHAFAARRTGAEAEIALDFMAGYAAFTPTRPLRKLERIGISFAGPATQIIAGTLVYFAVGGRGWRPEHDALQVGAWWAGPVIGLFNLIPILPFDGGNILQVAIEAITPRHARRIMYGVTIGVCGGAIAWMMIDPTLQPLVIFAAIPLITVAQMISADRAQSQRTDARAQLARAEAMAWATDTVDFPHGTVPSPWYRAWQQLRSGNPHMARDLILADLADTNPVSWCPPDAAPRAALEQLAELLPRPLPPGRSFSSYVLSDVLLRVGEVHTAGTVAAEAYGTYRSPMLAVHVARAAAAMDDRSTAFAWLSTAARDAHPSALRAAIDNAPEFAALRHDPALAAAISN